MSAAILLITHEELGTCMIDVACEILNCSKTRPHLIEVPYGGNPDEILKQAQAMIDKIDQGDGIIILTDMYGSTPSNIAKNLIHPNTHVIAGLNLPMLVRVMNYHDKPMDIIIEKAISGGKEGIVLSEIKS
jgi:PTS system ascorbate-specific IIA component